MAAAVEARYRGGFMSINSAVQQFSMGLASLVSGALLGVNERGEITHYPIAGLLSIFCAYTCIYLARFLKPAPEATSAEAPIAVMETM